MADTSADEFSQFPVESVARFLTVCGSEDPELLRRTRAPSAPPARQDQNRKAPQTVERESYLEELVSIAVASARQAEDAVRQAHAAGISARRRMFALAAFGVAAIFAGGAGVCSQYLHWAYLPGATGLKYSAAGVPAQAAVSPQAPITTPITRTPVEVRVAGLLPAPHEEVAVAALPSVAAMREQPPTPATPPVDERTAAVQAPETMAVAAASPPIAQSPEAVEATPHVAASIAPSPDAARPPAPATVAVASAAPDDAPAAIFVPPRPFPPQSRTVEASRPAAPRAASPSPSLTRVHSTGGRPITPSQLVAAVQALESLTDEMPASPVHKGPAVGFNKRM